MAHLSKTPLSKVVLSHVRREFFNAIKRDATHILPEILTDVESTMVAKRFMTILMLIDEQSYYRIREALGTQVATSMRLHKMLLAGEFNHIEALARNARKRKEMGETIGNVLRGGLPKNRYLIKKQLDLPMV